MILGSFPLTEHFNACRQSLQTPISIIRIDIVKSSAVLENSISGSKIYPMVMPDEFDIDTEDDWKKRREI